VDAAAGNHPEGLPGLVASRIGEEEDPINGIENDELHRFADEHTRLSLPQCRATSLWLAAVFGNVPRRHGESAFIR